MNKKIFFIINSIDGGGAERVFSELVNELELDLKKIIISLDKNIPKYKIYGEVYYLSKYKILSAVLLFFMFIRHRPVVAVSFLTRSNFLNIIFSKILGVKSIISERSNTLARVRGKFVLIKSKILSFIYNQADVVVSCSKGVQDCLSKYFKVTKPKMSVIYNPYDVEKINRYIRNVNDNNEEYFCLVGRLVKTKRFKDAIDAIAGTNVKIKILGDGPLRTELSETVKQLGLEKQVEFLGFIEDPHQVVKNSIGFILTSECEGFPNAVLEAMLLNIPCILSNCKDGPSELLEYDEEIEKNDFVRTKNGLMFNVGDVEALRKAILTIKNDKEISNAISYNALLKCSKFTKESFLEKFYGCIYE